jgi:hypothetical protein
MIRDALNGLRGTARAHMLERIKAYRAACYLASGPNPARSSYWQEKAARIANYIKTKTFNRTAPPGTAPRIGCDQCA